MPKYDYKKIKDKYIIYKDNKIYAEAKTKEDASKFVANQIDKEINDEFGGVF